MRLRIDDIAAHVEESGQPLGDVLKQWVAEVVNKRTHD